MSNVRKTMKVETTTKCMHEIKIGTWLLSKCLQRKQNQTEQTFNLYSD